MEQIRQKHFNSYLTANNKTVFHDKLLVKDNYRPQYDYKNSATIELKPSEIFPSMLCAYSKRAFKEGDRIENFDGELVHAEFYNSLPLGLLGLLGL